MPMVTDIPLSLTQDDVKALKDYYPPPYDLSYKRRNWEEYLAHKNNKERKDRENRHD